VVNKEGRVERTQVDSGSWNLEDSAVLTSDGR
jgi:hypothetical protein